MRAAWEGRKRALAEMGYAEDRGHGQFRAPSDLIAQLERADISGVGKALAAERGLTWQPSAPSEYVSGKLVGSTQFASGRFAMIDNGVGFQLVPLSDPLEIDLASISAASPCLAAWTGRSGATGP